MLHGAQGAVWLCLVRVPISATRLENTNPADNREQQKKTINKTIREKEKKKQRNSDVWWSPSYTKARRTVGRPLCIRDWVRSRLLSLQMSRLQNRTEQLTHRSKLKNHVGWQVLLPICKFGAGAVWAPRGLSTQYLLTQQPIPDPVSWVSQGTHWCPSNVTPGERPQTQSVIIKGLTD